MIPCPQCSVDNRLGAVFCARCGVPLQSSCPHCNAAVRVGACFCQRCGKTIAPAGIVCNACQTVNRAQAKFCRQCQQSLIASTQFTTCSSCDQPNKLEARFCRHCGAPALKEATKPCSQCGHGLRLEALFCPLCGQKQVQKTHETGKLSSHATVTGSDGHTTYLILSLIARGGMGAVYKAINASDQTIWAIKEMSESVISKEDWDHTLAAFYEEAHLLQTLTHENLPQVIDVFEDRSRHYIVMDFVKGHTLTELMLQAGGAISEKKVVTWGTQLCMVLDYLHSHNPPIIYRDLKPDNVMVETDSSRIKLIDFGIARRFKGKKKSDTVHLGTIGYAAPEQFGKSGQESDARTDIYALGATLHFLLTGLDPAANPFNFADVRVHARVSAEVGEAINRAVKILPTLRHQNAAEMYKALTGQSLPKQAPVKQKSTSASKIQVNTGGTAISTPGLKTTSLQADTVTKGVIEILTLPVTIGNNTVDISTDADWLTPSPQTADRHTKEIRLTADTSKLSLDYRKWVVTYQPDTIFGKFWWLILWLTYAHAYYFVPHAATHQATIHVGQEKADFQIEVVPSDTRTTVGWGLCGTAVALETMIPIGFIVFLLMGM